MLEKKIINGSNFIIKLGTNKLDKSKGLIKFALVFLKNSISSNKFNTIRNCKLLK